MVKMPKLWLHVEDDGTWLSEYPDDSPNKSRRATEADLTAERVAAYLDRNAERENYHDFVGLHSYLVGLIEVIAGKKCARAVMLVLLRHGGLHQVLHQVRG
jgi:hypothetical protein